MNDFVNQANAFDSDHKGTIFSGFSDVFDLVGYEPPGPMGRIYEVLAGSVSKILERKVSWAREILTYLSHVLS